ncbi:hypothetical protein Stsp01_24730 [Streptomyces sp. NBRC 13847]|nr:hypothetical protein Stsp01_24730 [Streptomyces sp. NBRC 13847]
MPVRASDPPGQYSTTGHCPHEFRTRPGAAYGTKEFGAVRGRIDVPVRLAAMLRTHATAPAHPNQAHLSRRERSAPLRSGTPAHGDDFCCRTNQPRLTAG